MNTNKYKIEQREMPPKPHGGRKDKYPWLKLEVTKGKVGSCFFVPYGNLRSLQPQALRKGHQYNRKFIVRAIKIDGVPGVCVWRIK